MSVVAILDGAFFLGAATALFLLLAGWRRRFHLSTKVLLAGLFISTSVYALSLLVEWTHISYAFDSFEDYVGAVIPVWWIASLYALYHEVTSRELNTSRERLHLALEGANDALWDLKTQEREVYFSPRWFTMLGYEPDAFPHTVDTWISLLHPEDYDATVREAGAFLNGEVDVYSCEFRMRDANGGWRWIQARGKACAWDDNGKSIRAVGTHTDITGQKEAEIAVRNSEQQYRSLFESSMDAILILAIPSRQFISANPAALKMFGFERVEDICGLSPADLSPEFQPSGATSADHARGVVDSALTDGGTRFRRWYRRKDESLFLADVTLTRLEIGAETIIQGALRDITHEVALEEQLRQSQKMEAIGQLAGGVAHDFNNLLQVITGYGAMVLDQLNDPDSRSNMNELMKASERARLLVRQLLAFGRRGAAEPQILDLNGVITDVMKMLGRLLGEHIQVEYRLDSSALPIRADAGMIEQVLVNLCINARDAMPDGGRLTIETARACVSREHRDLELGDAAGERAVLRVTDTGHGMDKETSRHVFEPYFTTKVKDKGTGLGLTTVYGIVHQHDGIISCDSAPGKGACFTVYLPIADQLPEASAAKGAESVVGGTETILFAEDEDSVRALAIRLLRSAGYTVHAVENGRLAVEQFERNPSDFDVVLLDVVMPEMGGREAYERIRAIRPSVPVIFASGYSDGMLPEQATEFAHRLVQKPYSRETILRAIRDALEG